MSTKVEIKGLRELESALRKVDAEVNKGIASDFKALAERVASKIRGKVPVRTGRARDSIKSRGSQRGGAIAFGGQQAPYYPWLDFGGKVGKRDSVTRPFLSEGRYVYPTLKEEQSDIMKQADEIVRKAIDSGGFE